MLGSIIEELDGQKIGYNWLTNVYDPISKAWCLGESHLLILDGYVSHINYKFHRYCQQNNIVVFCLPLHLLGACVLACHLDASLPVLGIVVDEENDLVVRDAIKYFRVLEVIGMVYGDGGGAGGGVGGCAA